ncbi:MAG TPA: hypothetical protein VFR00_05090 [Hyphomicrobiaceae bacterium]|jgi:hypothetical protein|nr:hypothetical protein [Hyphomicrobiaceae bacterium]
MRVLGPVVTGVLACLSLLAVPAEAGEGGWSFGGRIEQLPEGQGCYWFGGHLYCNRWCYWEIDGYRYCQRRVGAAISQAPPVLLYDFEPRRYDRIRRGPIVQDNGPPPPPPRKRPIPRPGPDQGPLGPIK